MQARLPFASLLLALAALLSSPSVASSELVTLTRQTIPLQQAKLKKQAEVAVLRMEKECLDPRTHHKEAMRVGDLTRFDRLLQVINEHLKHDDQRLEELGKLETSMNKSAAEALDGVEKAELARAELLEKWIDYETRRGVNLEQGGFFAWWDDFTLYLLVLGAVIVFVSYLLGVHSNRRAVRRWLRFHGKMGVAVLLLALLGVSGCGGLPAISPPGAGPHRRASEVGALNASRGQLRQEIEKLDTDRIKLEKEVRKSRSELLKRWEEFLAPLAPGLRQDEEAAYEKLHAALVAAHTTELAAKEGRAAFDQVTAKKQQFEAGIGREQDNALVRGGTRIGLCSVLAVLAFVPLWHRRRRLQQQLEEEGNKCPCCLSEDQLEMRTSQVRGKRFPEVRHVHCGECQYDFDDNYRQLPRLCFPTVGIRSSGKTHWLVTAYDMVKNKRVAVEAVFSKEPSLMDEKFDALIDSILKSRNNARATNPEGDDFPYPLVFHFEDTDRLKRGHGMLNLFDFSGELVKLGTIAAEIRMRALMMEGFVLFLDPTQIHGGGALGDLSMEDQIRAVANFCAEMRKIRHLSPRDRLNLPVAVCISKLDLLGDKNSKWADWIKELLKTEHQPITLQLLRQRSRLCEEQLPLMFPGWNIRRTLKESFGGRCLFFPMTPVSLIEEDLGETDLRKRRGIVPFGIMEPILWLLHMHGYNILR
ncbi:MAG TPA: hypothetical protein VEL76_30050 [Gemmataceae bacterium]|nr:hypothetical protein [Gemmataceae bacterium]